MEPIHTEEYKGYVIKIFHDDDPMHPRKDCDPYGTLIHWHRRYDLGERVDGSEAQERIDDVINNGGEVLPVYMYEHGGIVLNTTCFSCPWDSGQVGFLYLTKAEILEYFGVKRVTKSVRQKVVKALTSVIKEYSDYLNGNVYGYIVEDSSGNDVDSCFGFIGDYNGEYSALSEAKSIVDFRNKKAA